jgi:carboxyl-terminal processing protease
MRRATVSRGGPLALVAVVLLACGEALTSSSPAASPPSRSQPAGTPAVAPLPSATNLSTAVRPCDYVPGAPVAEIAAQPEPSYAPPPQPPATTVDRATTRRQLEVLNELWRVVDSNYVDPARTGSDWLSVRARYREIVQAGISEDDFYTLLGLMVYELGDEHSFVESPTEVKEAEAALEGQNDYAGIGALMVGTVDTKRLVVIVPWPGSPAERAGLRSHDQIIAADGQVPVEDDGAARVDLIRGPVGTSVTLTVERPGGERRDIVIVREQITGSTPVEICMIPNTRVLYVSLVTLFDRLVDDQIRTALEAVEAEGPLEGLVLDNRNNDGGSSDVLEAVLALFVSGEVGEFRSPDGTRTLDIDPVDIAGSQTIPLAVLVGFETASYGEILSGVLQAEGRAKVIGDTTPGNVETLHGHKLSDGSMAWIARETFEATRATYGPWEDTGIIPDRMVPARWDKFTEATDPALPVALELLGVR